MTTSTEEKAIGKPDLMKEIGIDMDEISRRMAFVDLTEEDIALLSDMEDFAKGYADQAVASFYQHLLSFRETRLLLKDQGMIDRLISSQKIYLMDIFRGRFNKAYFERRLRTGAIHYKIGLKPKWYMEIYAYYENVLTSLISKAYGHEPDRGLKRDQALRKVFRLDMVLALEYYFHSYYLEMTAKLNNNLRSMDDFTRMLSHDLKEPLRGIEAFSSFLLEDYSSVLDHEGQRYLNFLKESATRMKELIHDLLTLVSIKQKGPNLDAVDLNPVLSQVITDLKFSVEQKNATVRVLKILPTLRCDAIQVGEVFRNLISNAIKFNTAEKPLIEISAEELKSSYCFSVKDNGIGIDEAYQEQILQAFERLHPQDEFEGTGVGLAICKRIVENYGGKLWLESKPDEGSTFYFSLPKNSAF